MQYFHRLLENVQTHPVMNVLVRHRELWEKRPPHGGPHQLILRAGLLEEDLETINLPPMGVLPIMERALDIMRLVGGWRLGRVVIVKLEPGERTRTVPSKSPYYTQYRLVLQGLPGVLFTCGDETVSLLTGELWWCDPAIERSMVNNSKDDLVYLSIDAKVD